jgi:hypothetical protein
MTGIFCAWIIPHAKPASSYLNESIRFSYCPAAAPCPAGKNGALIEAKELLRITPPYFTACQNSRFRFSYGNGSCSIFWLNM